ncbi:MAG: hypothetical protein JO297_17050 [Nitrososphaeraceae archaeon]|nr:hypothetical protein [Nitrososphaeraceae archaeon]
MSRFLVNTARSYEKLAVNHANERIIYEIYKKASSSLLNDDRQLHNIREKQLVKSS